MGAVASRMRDPAYCHLPRPPAQVRKSCFSRRVPEDRPRLSRRHWASKAGHQGTSQGALSSETRQHCKARRLNPRARRARGRRPQRPAQQPARKVGQSERPSLCTGPQSPKSAREEAGVTPPRFSALTCFLTFRSHFPGLPQTHHRPIASHPEPVRLTLRWRTPASLK